MSFIHSLLSQGWVGTVVGLAGIVLAIIFYLRSKQKVKLAFQYDHIMLVGGRGAAFPDEIEIRFSGTVVPRITASMIVIWNCGDRTINGADLVAGDQLRLDLSDKGRILKHTILRQTRSVNGWKFDQTAPNLLNLSFEFLDPGDGISLEVVHSETGSKLNVKGTIRGMPEGMRNYGRTLRFFYRHQPSALIPLNRLRPLYAIAIIIGCTMMLCGLLHPSLEQWFPTAFGQNATVDPQIIRWVLVVLGLLYAAIPGFFLWSLRRRYPAALEPTQEGGGDGQNAEPSTA